MFLDDVGVSERDRRGWKFGSPPVLEQPGVVASMLEGDSTITSSGSGGAPGSPGRGRQEEVMEETAPDSEGHAAPFCNDGRLSELAMSEVHGLRSPSGWKSMVELLENVRARSLLVLGELRLLSDEELEAPAVLRQTTERSLNGTTQ